MSSISNMLCSHWCRKAESLQYLFSLSLSHLPSFILFLLFLLCHKLFFLSQVLFTFFIWQSTSFSLEKTHWLVWFWRFFFFCLSYFYSFNFFLLKDNCFTEFCCFLSNLNMNQPQVYIYPLPFETLSHLIPHLTSLGWYRTFEFPETYSKFLLAIYRTHGNVHFHVTLSIHLTLSSPSPCP